MDVKLTIACTNCTRSYKQTLPQEEAIWFLQTLDDYLCDSCMEEDSFDSKYDLEAEEDEEDEE